MKKIINVSLSILLFLFISAPFVEVLGYFTDPHSLNGGLPIRTSDLVRAEDGVCSLGWLMENYGGRLWYGERTSDINGIIIPTIEEFNNYSMEEQAEYIQSFWFTAFPDSYSPPFAYDENGDVNVVFTIPGYPYEIAGYEYDTYYLEDENATDLNKYQNAYYNDNGLLISDSVYDCFLTDIALRMFLGDEITDMIIEETNSANNEDDIDPNEDDGGNGEYGYDNQENLGDENLTGEDSSNNSGEAGGIEVAGPVDPNHTFIIETNAYKGVKYRITGYDNAKSVIERIQ